VKTFSIIRPTDSSTRESASKPRLLGRKYSMRAISSLLSFGFYSSFPYLFFNSPFASNIEATNGDNYDFILYIFWLFLSMTEKLKSKASLFKLDNK